MAGTGRTPCVLERVFWSLLDVADLDTGGISRLAYYGMSGIPTYSPTPQSFSAEMNRNPQNEDGPSKAGDSKRDSSNSGSGIPSTPGKESTSADAKHPISDQEKSFEELSQQANVGLIREFVDFLKYNKKWWLTPIIAVLLLVGLLIVLTTSGAAPFLYTFW